MAIDSSIVQSAIAEAEFSATPVSHLSIESVAARAGISRSTLFRRIGTRAELEAAVADAGVDPGVRNSVRERAAAAAEEILTTKGLGALTLEAVAARAECSYGALHAQFGGREGLLAATFRERSPVADIESLLLDSSERPIAALVGDLYAIILARIAIEGQLLPAMVAEALARPDSSVGTNFRRDLSERLYSALDRWLDAEVRAGRARWVPTAVAVELLLTPLVGGVLLDFPEPDEPDEATLAALVRAFCAAIGAEAEPS